MTDGEARLLGTMKITSMKSNDRKTIELANKKLENMPRRTFLQLDLILRQYVQLGFVPGQTFVGYFFRTKF